MRRELKIDSEFATIIPKLDIDEYELLEKSILEDGRVIEPIVVWNDTIVDGHNRYRIAAKHPEIEFETTEMSFPSKQDCLDWICIHQLGRRNLDAQKKKYLVGMLYQNSKATHGGYRHGGRESSGQIDHLTSTAGNARDKIAELTNTSSGYVKHAEAYVNGVNLAEQLVPGTKQKILDGKIKATAGEIGNLVKVPTEKQKQAVLDLSNPNRKSKPTKEDEEDEQRDKEKKYNPDFYNDRKPVFVTEEQAVERINENDALGTIQGGVWSFIKIYTDYTNEFPTLITDKQYRSQLLEILKEIETIIKELERKPYQ